MDRLRCEVSTIFWTLVLLALSGLRPGAVSALDNKTVSTGLSEVSTAETAFLAAAPEGYFYDFLEGEEAWHFVSAPPFSPPLEQSIPNAPGYLSLKAQRNQDTFGYWESPTLGLVIPDSVYVAESFVTTSVSDPARVPQLRLRSTSENVQQSVFITSESRGDGAFSPTASGRSYFLVYSPAPGGERAWLEFELLNFDPGADPQGDFRMDWVRLTRHAVTDLVGRTPVRTYTFENSVEGWNDYKVSPYNSPYFGRSNGALVLKGAGKSNTFGYWASNPADIAINSGLLYMATFRVGCSLSSTYRSKVPQFRVRLNESTFHGSSVLAVESKGDASRSPVSGMSQDYVVFFRPPEVAQGKGLILSFDLANFDPNDSLNASLYLYNVTVETAPYPW